MPVNNTNASTTNQNETNTTPFTSKPMALHRTYKERFDIRIAIQPCTDKNKSDAESHTQWLLASLLSWHNPGANASSYKTQNGRKWEEDNNNWNNSHTSPNNSYTSKCHHHHLEHNQQEKASENKQSATKLKQIKKQTKTNKTRNKK